MEFECEVRIVNAPRGTYKNRRFTSPQIHINPSEIFDSNSYKKLMKTPSSISHFETKVHLSSLNFAEKAKEFSVFKWNDDITAKADIQKKTEENTISNIDEENEQHNEEIILLISPKATSNDEKNEDSNEDFVICLKIGDSLEIEQTHLNLNDVIHERLPIQNSPSCETIVESEI